MFDPLRSELDVAEDIKRLNNICEEWKLNKKMILACEKQLNVKFYYCPECKDKELSDKFKCKKCGGIGIIAEINKQEDNNG